MFGLRPCAIQLGVPPQQDGGVCRHSCPGPCAPAAHKPPKHSRHGEAPRGNPCAIFLYGNTACAVCLPVLCVCDVWSLGRTCAGTSPNAVTPHPPSQDVSLLCSDVLISCCRAPSCTNRRSLSYQSHSIWHSGTDFISQHLVLTSVTPSRADLAASRAIYSHHVSHQSPQHLVPISQHLAPISQHLVPQCQSRTISYRPSTICADLAEPCSTDFVAAPSCSISTARLPSKPRLS